MPTALSLADARAHLNIDVDTYDTELTAMIVAAEAVIAKRCGPLASTTTTSKVDGGGRSLLLPCTPVVSLTSVTANTGDVVSVSDLTVLNPGVVQYTTSGACFPAAWYTVVYQSGRATLPADLLQADKELVKHMWATQRGGAVRPGGASSTEQVQFAAQVGALPPRVIELIGGHLQPGFA